jgi:hypothetical protein
MARPVVGSLVVFAASATFQISVAKTGAHLIMEHVVTDLGESVEEPHVELRLPDVSVSRMETFVKPEVTGQQRGAARVHIDNTVVRTYGQDVEELKTTVRRSPEKELASHGATITRGVQALESTTAGASQESQGVVRWHTPTSITKEAPPFEESSSRWSQSARVETPLHHRRPLLLELGRGLLVGGLCGIIRLIGDADSMGILRTSIEVEGGGKMIFQTTFTVGALLGLIRSFAMAFVVAVWILVFGSLGLDLFRDCDVGDYVNGVALLLCALRFSLWGSRFPPPPVEKKQLSNDALCSGKPPLPEKDTPAVPPPCATGNGIGGAHLRVLDASAVLGPVDLVGAVGLARLGLDGMPSFLVSFVLVSGLGNATLGACWNALTAFTDAVTLDRTAGRLSCGFATVVGTVLMLLRPHDLVPGFSA